MDLPLFTRSCTTIISWFQIFLYFFPNSVSTWQTKVIYIIYICVCVCACVREHTHEHTYIQLKPIQATAVEIFALTIMFFFIQNTSKYENVKIIGFTVLNDLEFPCWINAFFLTCELDTSYTNLLLSYIVRCSYALYKKRKGMGCYWMPVSNK